MDKAQAYAVLRIEPGCTQEEIKEAYAALSRQYHPEEYPEEFQQIHDAYRMLRRREQRHHTIHPVTVAGTKETDLQLGDVTEETELQPVDANVTEEADPETSSGVPAEQELEEQTENPEQSEAVPQYDFDEVIEEEQREEEQKQILEMDRELKQQIFRVADDMYCYKHYFLPIRHFEASVFIYKHGIDCIEHPESIQNKDILDVGGYIGDSILILKPLTHRRVYSFEATEKNFTLMKETIKLNHLKNVIPEHMALGREKGSMEMKLAGPSSAFHENGVATVTGTETVQVDTLDAYMEGTDIEVGLIKVDIEGAEQDFLAGARKTIEKHKPVLLMSIYHNADDFFDIKPIIESWNLGYKFRIHKPVDYSVSREVLLIAEVR